MRGAGHTGLAPCGPLQRAGGAPRTPLAGRPPPSAPPPARAPAAPSLSRVHCAPRLGPASPNATPVFKQRIEYSILYTCISYLMSVNH